MSNCRECGTRLLPRNGVKSVRDAYTPKIYCGIICRNKAALAKRLLLNPSGRNASYGKIIDVKGTIVEPRKALGGGE